jgi:hypothetical protein
MTELIAIFLILKAINNGNKMLKEKQAEVKISEGVAFAIHLFLGLWMLIKL